MRLQHALFKWIPVAVFVIIIISVSIPFFVRQGRRSKNDDGYDVLLDYRPKEEVDPSAIYVRLIVSNMNTHTFDITTAASVQNGVPKPLLNPKTGALDQPIRVQIQTGVLELTKNSVKIDTPLVSKILVAKGTIAWYPFDKYNVRMLIVASQGGTFLSGENITTIPIEPQVVSPKDYAWTFKATKSDRVATGIKTIEIEVSRDYTLYTALVFIGIWAVTFSIAYIGSMSVIWERRPADYPVIYISALFAVPIFRNTLPGTPPYGVLFDILCTYFAIAVISVFNVLVAIAYIKRK
ncbi:unnamed protein product, partial [Aphanomyces euteiches]